MIEEIDIGVGFLTKLFDRILSFTVRMQQRDPAIVAVLTQRYRQDLARFKEVLSNLLIEKYTGHWYENEPKRGQGFRCLLGNVFTCDPLLQRAVVLSELNYSCLNHALCAMTLWIDPMEVAYRIEGGRPHVHEIAMQESKTLHRSYVDYNFIVSEINHMYQVRKGHPNVQTYLTHPPSPSFGQRAGNPPVSSTNNPSITSTSSSRYQSANHSNFYQQEKQKEFTEPYLLPVRSFSPHFSGNMYSTSLTSLATTMMSLTNDNINDNNSEETFQRCSSANSILASITAANNQIGISKYDRRTFATTKSLLNKRNPTTNLISSDWPPLHHHDPPPPHCHPQLSSQSNSSTTIRIQARPSSTPHHYYSYQHQNDKSKQSEVDTWSLALSNQKKQPIVDLSKRTINNELETAHEASTQQKAGTVDPVTPDADPQVVSTDSDNMADTSKSPGAMSTKAQQQKQVKGYCGYVESYPYYYKMGKMQRAFIAQRQITNTILRYQQIAANLAAATAAAVVATSSSSSSSSAQHQSSYQNNEMRALRKSSRVNMTTNNGRNQQLNYNNASRLAKKGLRNDDVKQRQAQHVLVNEGALNSGESSLQKQHQALSRQKIRTAADSNKFLFLDQCRSRCYTQIPASGSHHIIVAAGGDSGLAGGCIPSDSTSSVIYHRQESRI